MTSYLVLDALLVGVIFTTGATFGWLPVVIAGGMVGVWCGVRQVLWCVGQFRDETK